LLFSGSLPTIRGPMSEGPALRANWTRMMLDYYELHLPPSAKSALEEQLDPQVRARLMAAGPLQWLPADVHMHILTAPLAVMGADAYRTFWHDMMIDSFDRPLFRSFVHGAVTAFQGLSGHVYRMVPRGFGLIARDCGEIDVEVIGKEKRAEVIWRSIPLVLRRQGAFPIAWAGTLQSVLTISGLQGSVSIELDDNHPSRVHYHATWRK
jgi:hypothetical protein